METEVTEEERAAMWDALSDGKEPSEAQEVISENPPEVEEKEPPKVVDPWAGIAPEIKEAFTSMSSKVESFDAMALRLKQAESRIGALQNKLTQAPPAPTDEEKRIAAEDDEKWNALKEDFPEWANEMERRSAKTDTTLKDQREEYLKAQQDIKSELGKKIDEIEQKVTVQLEKSALSLKYSDWENIIETKDYKQWLEIQPLDIKKKTGSSLAKDAISVLDKFTKDKQQKSPAVTAEERKRRLSESVIVNGSSTRAAKSEADMTEDEYRASLAAELWPGNKK